MTERQHPDTVDVLKTLIEDILAGEVKSFALVAQFWDGSETIEIATENAEHGRDSLAAALSMMLLNLGMDRMQRATSSDETAH